VNLATHHQLSRFIWRICNLLRGPYKPKEYGDVILPLTVLRRFDCVLAPTKQAVLEAHDRYGEQIDTVRRHHLEKASGVPFYNTSSLDFAQLLNDPSMIADNLHAYMRGFSPNVRDIMDRFGMGEHIARMDERNILYEVLRQFANIDLSPARVDNIQMGYAFEELIRIGAEHSKDEAGDHFTPREVIRLMVSLLLSPEPDLGKGYAIKKIYDPAAGTGGMLSAADEYLREHNSEAEPKLFGQDWNAESWAICKSDMLIKGDDAERIILGDTFTEDGYKHQSDGSRWTFDYMLANPPFGVEWKAQRQFIEHEHKTLGYDGRFGAGLPAVTDGSLLFLQHMLSKMEPVGKDGGGGSRIAIVFNGSPLFAGNAGRGANRIRRWIIENDWIEAIVALPDQMFYNTAIATYIWVLTNRKEPHRVGKVQLIDGRQFFVKMGKSLGQKRNELSPEHIDDLTRIHGNFEDGETRDLTDEDPLTHQPRTRPRVVSKILNNEDFGYRKLTVKRPLRLNFAATPERVARIEEQTRFQNLANSKKRTGPARDAQVAAGRTQQDQIRGLLHTLAQTTSGAITHDRQAFLDLLTDTAKAAGVRLLAPHRDAILAALGERDPEASICRDRHGNPEPDPNLERTETVPLTADVDEHVEREVLPHFPDAWVDYSAEKMAYEIPLNRHFYVYEPPRALGAIKADLQELETDIVRLLAGLTE